MNRHICNLTKKIQEACSLKIFADSNGMTAEEQVMQTYEAADLFKGYARAMNRPDREKWIEAIRKELLALLMFNTFKRVEDKTIMSKLTPKQSPLGTVWVFKIKRDAKGQIIKYKARLCAQGFTQTYGVDYFETYAPVVRAITAKMFFAIGLKMAQDLDIYQLDIVNAFVNSDVKEDIFLKAPDGFELLSLQESQGIRKGDILQLLKSLYGLKQAGRNWNQTLIKFLVEELKFIQSEIDQCLLFGSSRSIEGVLMLIIYVDDILALCTGTGYQHLVTEIKKRFSVTEMGLAKYFLGIEIIRESHHIELRQTGDVQKILKRFGMEDCKSAKSPIDKNCEEVNLQHLNDEPCDVSVYRSLIGCLQYLQVWTRPDISFATSFLSRFLVNPKAIHMQMAKRVLRYLKGTDKNSLIFKRGTAESHEKYIVNETFFIHGYCDSDWANNMQTRKSVTGYLFRIYPGEFVAHCSVLQRIVTLSSFEAEYVALCDAAKESMWIKRLCQEIFNRLHLNKSKVQVKLHMHIDNQGTVSFANQPRLSKRSKHIDVRKHWVFNHVMEGSLMITYIPSERNLADFLTKALRKILFLYNISRIMRCTQLKNDARNSNNNALEKGDKKLLSLMGIQ